MQAGTRSQLQLAAVCSKQAAAVCSKQVATFCSKQAATKSKKSNLHTKNSQAATVPQLAAAAKPHACCLFAAIHCEKPFISIRESNECMAGFVSSDLQRLRSALGIRPV